MPLLAANYAILLTPSFIIDGHFPNGDDGTAAIPLTWTTVPDFTGKQQGVSFSVNLFTLYLTQPVGNTAVATLLSGALSGGWTLSSDGTLTYSGVGTGSGTIQVRASRLTDVSDSNIFSFESISIIVNPDNQAPTIPTGLHVTSVTSSVINVALDAPFDAPTLLIPASGLLQVRLFKNGLLDGVTSVLGGRSVLFSPADVGGGPARRFAKGWHTAVSPFQRDHWVANPGTINNGGPITSLTKGVNIRHFWNELEPTKHGFNFNLALQEYNICASFGVLYTLTIIVRTFNNGPNPAPGAGKGAGGADIDLALLAYQFTSTIDGTTGYELPRWNTEVSNRFNDLVKALGATFNSLPFFGGIATQETSVGNPPASTGYSLGAFQTSLIAEVNNIGAAFPNAPILWYFNFIQNGGMSDLGPVASVVQANGGVVGGPDGVLGGNITTSCYPIYDAVQNGVGTAATGTIGAVAGTLALGGVGPTFLCWQPAEYTNGKPANAPPGTLLQRFQYATRKAPYTSAPTDVSMLITDWRTSGGGYQFSDTWAVMSANPTFGPYTPPPSMVPGSIAQTGLDYNVVSAGTGLGTTSDQYSVARAQCNNDFVFIAKLTGITGANTNSAVAGISIREAVGTASRAAYLVASTTQLRSRYRGSAGAVLTTATTISGQGWPTTKWLKIARVGTTFTFFYSLNGNSWVACGSATIGMGAIAYADLFVASGLTTQVTAHFQQASVQSLTAPTYSFTSLAGGTLFDLSAATRDQAGNDSAIGAAIVGQTS